VVVQDVLGLMHPPVAEPTGRRDGPAAAAAVSQVCKPATAEKTGPAEVGNNLI
jgi:hypothetical protein